MMRLAAAGAVLAGVAACGGGAPSPGTQPGARPTPDATAPATMTPSLLPATNPPTSAPSATSPPGTSSARPSGTSPAPAGAAPVTGWLAGKDWTAIPTTRPVVALTFDVGANADAVPSILATLRREGIPATFFLTGDFVRDFPGARPVDRRRGLPDR